MNEPKPSFACLMSTAERELGAFISAVTESYGPEQARICAEDWLVELESMDGVPRWTTREWRFITIRAAARLASRLITSERFAADPTAIC